MPSSREQSQSHPHCDIQPALGYTLLEKVYRGPRLLTRVPWILFQAVCSLTWAKYLSQCGYLVSGEKCKVKGMNLKLSKARAIVSWVCAYTHSLLLLAYLYARERMTGRTRLYMYTLQEQKQICKPHTLRSFEPDLDGSPYSDCYFGHLRQTNSTPTMA